MKTNTYLKDGGGCITIMTVMDDWQRQCLDLARRDRPFNLQGLCSPTHVIFCGALCRAYDYQYQVNGAYAEFRRKRELKQPDISVENLAALKLPGADAGVLSLP